MRGRGCEGEIDQFFGGREDFELDLFAFLDESGVVEGYFAVALGFGG